MASLTAQADTLRDLIEDAAFLVSSNAPAREIHAKLVRCLAILEPMTQHAEPEPGDTSQAEVAEINKVARKLKRWVSRPEQINTRILKAYLELERSGASRITEADIADKIGGTIKLGGNLAQMKIIADRNHGKVFDQHGDQLKIWPPVEIHVREFEREVFGG